MAQQNRIAQAFLFLMLARCGAACFAQAGREPLRASQLLALIAGNALPEIVVNEINTDGLAFRPDDGYRSFLKMAGADAKVLTALDAAKVARQESPEAGAGKELLEHIAKAGALLRETRDEEAARELTASLTVSFDAPECGFVMGEVLREQEEWERAEAVYEQVLEEDPTFPEAHTKLSFIFYKLESDGQSALREAKAALARTPENPEAHKNAGLALMQMRKWDAAETEYNEALRLKPVYWAVDLDLGLLFANEGAWDKAIVWLKKALALDPNSASAAYNLGWVYDQKHEVDSAIREYREAKRIDPKRYDARQNLGHDLLAENRAAEAVKEFREMEAIFPNSSVCHDCLASALFQTWDLAGAEKEWLIAEQLDPSDALPHLGIGGLREQQNKYEEALEEYRRAEQMDPTLSGAWRATGTVLILQKNYS